MIQYNILHYILIYHTILYYTIAYNAVTSFWSRRRGGPKFPMVITLIVTRAWPRRYDWL